VDFPRLALGILIIVVIVSANLMVLLIVRRLGKNRWLRPRP
jgi:hypothetical protein